jgi:TIR domain
MCSFQLPSRSRFRLTPDRFSLCSELRAMSHQDDLTGHAFISYVREDESRVDELQQIFETAGISVWRDVAAIWPGEDWAAKIRRAITAETLVFIACFSQASVTRKSSYQYRELLLAIEGLQCRRPDDPWLIPVRFDDCDIPCFDIGGGRTLASLHRADLFGDGYAREASRLVETVQRAVGHRLPSWRAAAAPAMDGAAQVESKAPLSVNDPRNIDRNDRPQVGLGFEQITRDNTADTPYLPGNDINLGGATGLLAPPDDRSSAAFSPSGGDGRWWSRLSRSGQIIVAIVGATIAGIGVIGALNVTSQGASPGGPSNVAPSVTPNATTRHYTYTVDPTRWAPRPVPGLTLAKGDVVSIKALSGQWICARAAGPVGLQGDHFGAFNENWALPDQPFCSLIGKIGNGAWQEMGVRPRFVTNNSGKLALTVNELMPDTCTQQPANTSCYTDNTGSIKISITIYHKSVASTGSAGRP